MSLLNDVLRDLSRQQENHEAASAAHGTYDHNDSEPGNNDQQLFTQTSAARPLTRTWLPSIIAFIIVLAGFFLWDFFTAPTLLPQPTLMPAPPLVATTQTTTDEAFLTEPVQKNIESVAVKATEAALEEPSVEKAFFTEEINAAPSENNFATATTDEPQSHNSADVQSQIYELLQQASRAFTLDRLTSPVEDNAYAHYQQILLLDADNPAARQGLIKIAHRYLEMADIKIQQTDFSRADTLIQRAKWVAPDYPVIQTYIEKLAQVQVSLPNQEITVDVTSQPASDLTASKDEVESAVPDAADIAHTEASAQRSESIKEPFAAEAGPQHLSVAPNTEWQDQTKVQQARALIAQNNMSGAIQLLQSHINSAPQSDISIKFLLDIFYQQKLPDEMQSLLSAAHVLDPVERAYYTAKVALLNNENSQAIMVLESQLSAAQKQESYRALLASLYQEAGRFPESSSSYRRLIGAFGDKPAYWLGFALALDAQNQKLSALQAYQRLAEFNDLQIEVRRYIDQRIVDLAPSQVNE